MFTPAANISVGGASGCVIASRLAKSAQKPSVLLVEAGGDNKDVSYLVPADRFTLAFKEASLNWGYKTVPQSHLKSQEIDYSRGKGLGGSTAINFSCWVIGADEVRGQGAFHFILMSIYVSWTSRQSGTLECMNHVSSSHSILPGYSLTVRSS